MYEVFADLHVHIGRSETGKPIKITSGYRCELLNKLVEITNTNQIKIKSFELQEYV